MTEHEIKCWPEYYEPIANGAKRFELRKNDRNYQVGDMLLIREWAPNHYDSFGEYTGRSLRARITYMSSEPHRKGGGSWFGLQVGWVILSIHVEPS